MIFVTVGTHEQQFDRLIKEIDKLKYEGIINEEVFIQIGFSTYKPVNCRWEKIISYRRMNKLLNEARIIITHGGPASFIAALKIGKIPIVVPRKVEFEEHVNNHQVEFTKSIFERLGTIIPVYEIEDLKKELLNYEKNINSKQKKIKLNNHEFCKKFQDIVIELLGE